MPKPADKTKFHPKHVKDRVRKIFKNDARRYVVVDDQGGFLTANGTFDDAGDAMLYSLKDAHDLAGSHGVLDVSQHPQLAILFYTNR